MENLNQFVDVQTVKADFDKSGSAPLSLNKQVGIKSALINRAEIYPISIWRQF